VDSVCRRGAGSRLGVQEGPRVGEQTVKPAVGIHQRIAVVVGQAAGVGPGSPGRHLLAEDGPHGHLPAVDAPGHPAARVLGHHRPELGIGSELPVDGD
jgi:hypothetical protein